MNIPTTFQLFGSTYKVEFDNIYCNDKEALGLFCDNLKTIKLADTYGIDKLPQDTIDETYYHELSHCILKNAGLDIWKDEKAVEVIGRLLMQYMSSIK